MQIFTLLVLCRHKQRRQAQLFRVRISTSVVPHSPASTNRVLPLLVGGTIRDASASGQEGSWCTAARLQSDGQSGRQSDCSKQQRSPPTLRNPRRQ